jgi:hypothetical protein
VFIKILDEVENPSYFEIVLEIIVNLILSNMNFHFDMLKKNGYQLLGSIIIKKHAFMNENVS